MGHLRKCVDYSSLIPFFKQNKNGMKPRRRTEPAPTTTTTIIANLQRRHPVIGAELKVVPCRLAQLPHQGFRLQRPANVYFAGLQPQKSPGPRVAASGAPNHLNFVDHSNIKGAVHVDLTIHGGKMRESIEMRLKSTGRAAAAV